jgi:hypothetical protein
MRPAPHSSAPPTRSHTPRAFTVFAAAFVAGAAAAVAVNSVLDVRLAQSKPQVESEPIFVALRSLPQGAPVTVWDVALREWPRAMVPTSALRSSDTFSGLVLKHPLREGQPLLSIQLVEADPRPTPALSVTAVSTPPAPTTGSPDADLWAPAEPSRPDPVTAVPAPVQPEQEDRRQPPAMQQAELAPPGAPAVVGLDQPSMPAPPAVAATPAGPGADELVPPPAEENPAAVAATTMPPVPTADRSGTDESLVDQNMTDESLQAMVATTTPAAESFIVPPADDVIAARSEDSAASAGDSRADRADVATAEPMIAAPADDVIAAQPAPTPTLADPPLAPVANDTAGGEATAASVMRQPTTADVDAAPAPVPMPPRVATRYLVVPESIALQADASFAAPRPAPPAAAETVKPLPPTTGAPGRPQPADQPAQQRASQPRRGTSAAAPGNGGQGRAAPQASSQQPRRSLFPNIAAGIESLEGDTGRARRDRSEQPAPAATPRPRPQY